MEFTLRITNVGTRQATGLVVSDVRPQFTTLSAASVTAGWSCNTAGVCSKNVTNPLAAGASTTETVSFRVDSPLACGTTSTVNSASVTETCQQVSAASESVTVPLNSTVQYVFTATIPTSINLDDTIENCFDAVFNYGNSGSTNTQAASFTVAYNGAFLSTTNTACSAGQCTFNL